MNLTLDYQRYHAYVFTNKRLRGTVACYTCGATRNWFKLEYVRLSSRAHVYRNTVFSASRTLDNSSAHPVGFNYHNPLYYQPYLPYTVGKNRVDETSLIRYRTNAARMSPAQIQIITECLYTT